MVAAAQNTAKVITAAAISRIKEDGFVKRFPKKIFTLSAIVLSLCIVTGGMYAWYLDHDSVKNEMNLIHHDIEIVEGFVPPDWWLPAQEVEKAVNFVNTGQADALLRIKYDEYWLRKSGSESAILSNRFEYLNGSGVTVEEDSVLKSWNTNFNPGAETQLWVDGGDGYFYYKKVLPAGQNTGQVLDSITLNANIVNSQYAVDYFGAEYNLTFFAEAILSNASLEAVQRHFGSHVTKAQVNPDGTVTWGFN